MLVNLSVKHNGHSNEACMHWPKFVTWKKSIQLQRKGGKEKKGYSFLNQFWKSQNVKICSWFSIRMAKASVLIKILFASKSKWKQRKVLCRSMVLGNTTFSWEENSASLYDKSMKKVHKKHVQKFSGSKLGFYRS